MNLPAVTCNTSSFLTTLEVMQLVPVTDRTRFPGFGSQLRLQFCLENVFRNSPISSYFSFRVRSVSFNGLARPLKFLYKDQNSK